MTENMTEKQKRRYQQVLMKMQGCTNREVAAHFGISHQSIAEALTDMCPWSSRQPSCNVQHHNLDAATMERIAKALVLNRGKSLADVAKAAGVKKTTLKKATDYMFACRHKISGLNLYPAIEQWMRMNLYTCDSLAEKIHSNRTTVQQILHGRAQMRLKYAKRIQEISNLSLRAIYGDFNLSVMEPKIAERKAELRKAR